MTDAAWPATNGDEQYLTCEFDTDQGIWHLTGDSESFYSVSLGRARKHASELYGDVPVAAMTSDDSLNRLFESLRTAKDDQDRRSIRGRLLRFIDENEIPIGGADLHYLLDEDDAILDGWEPVVIAAHRRPDSADRVAAAVIQDDEFVVVLDGERRSTKELIARGGVFLRRAADDWRPTGWAFDSVEQLTDDERRRLEQRTSAPLAVSNLKIRGHRHRDV